ncbi:MAG: alpha-glucosidase [Gammaproteobacteria bacterium]|nr:alpha-glucosidase [Gammaproteobacteria bacterium]
MSATNDFHEWWRGCVIYQVYPRSFQDSNGDGIGDLGGITKRLPYIASLGVDALWISPFYKSPMKDFGYDVSDYCNVDPMFGTLLDFDGLIESAHNLGLKVIIDLVLSHSSDKHPWFKESRGSRNNSRSDWYVWADPKPDGTAPNNWLSIFGGSAWQWDTRREQYYLHNFLTSQPDLNFHCHEVQDAILNVTRFWLERGVDGFRLDTVNFYTHDSQLRDNPALALEHRNASIAPMVNPYNYQEHIYSKNRPENLEFLERFRSLLDEYDNRTCLGEVGDAQRGLEILGQYTAGNDHAHMCYAFELMESEVLTPHLIKELFSRMDKVAADGWACWVLSNHDVIRHASRWRLNNAALRMFANLLLCLRGSVCIYQGEELGLCEADLEFEDLQDPYGIEFWPEFKGRDGCRTPMVWEDDVANAGFSAVKPWLPVSDFHQRIAVSLQEEDESSLLNHYRNIIALRHAHSVLATGEIEIVEAGEKILGFLRKSSTEQIYCIFNMCDESAELTLPVGGWESIGHAVGCVDIPQSGPLCLDAWQSAIILKKQKEERKSG